MGAADEWVVSGSDCGYIYIWDKASGKLQQWLHGDRHVVNCLEPHPTLPTFLATSGTSLHFQDNHSFREVRLEPRGRVTLVVAPGPRALPASLIMFHLQTTHGHGHTTHT